MRQQLDDARKEASDLRRQMDRLTAAQTVRESQLRPVERHLRMLLPAKLVQRFPVGSASLRDSSLDASDLDLSGAETSSDWDLPAAEIASILFQYRQDPSAFLCAGTRLPPVFKTWPSRKPWPGIERVCEGKGMPMMELERGVKWPMVWIRCESCLCHL